MAPDYSSEYLSYDSPVFTNRLAIDIIEAIHHQLPSTLFYWRLLCDPSKIKILVVRSSLQAFDSVNYEFNGFRVIWKTPSNNCRRTPPTLNGPSTKQSILVLVGEL